MDIREVKVCYIKTPWGMLSLVPVTEYQARHRFEYNGNEEVFALPQFLYADDQWRALPYSRLLDWCEINGFEYVDCVIERFGIPDQKEQRKLTGCADV